MPGGIVPMCVWRKGIQRTEKLKNALKCSHYVNTLACMCL